MAPPLAWRLAAAAAVALQGLTQCLSVDLAAADRLRGRLEAVDADKLDQVAELAVALSGRAPALDEALVMRRWLDEAIRASVGLEEEPEEEDVVPRRVELSRASGELGARRPAPEAAKPGRKEGRRRHKARHERHGHGGSTGSLRSGCLVQSLLRLPRRRRATICTKSS